MSKKITYKQVKAVADRLVEERGLDYVYEHPTKMQYDIYGENPVEKPMTSCVYADRSGTPSCIVGVITSELAPELFDKLKEHEWTELGETLGSRAISSFHNSVREVFTSKAYRFLRTAQGEQDAKKTWAESVAIAAFYAQ